MAVRPDMVRRAVTVIAPAPARRAECEAKVRAAFAMVSNNPFARMFHGNTKRAKLQAGRLSAVIRRLRATLGHPDLDKHLRSFFPDMDVPGILAKDFARTVPLRSPDDWLQWHETGRWLDEWLERAEAAQSKKGKTIRLNATKKKQASLHAVHLLKVFKKEISTARGSRLCRLAALLYGQPRANLQKQCREVLRTEYLLRPKRG